MKLPKVSKVQDPEEPDAESEEWENEEGDELQGDQALDNKAWIAQNIGRRLGVPRRGQKAVCVAQWLVDRDEPEKPLKLLPQRGFLPQLAPVSPKATDISRLRIHSPRSSIIIRSKGASSGSQSARSAPARISAGGKEDDDALYAQRLRLLGAPTSAQRRKPMRQIRRFARPMVADSGQRQLAAEEIDPKADAPLVRDMSVFEKYYNGALIGPGSIFSHDCFREPTAPGLYPQAKPDCNGHTRRRSFDFEDDADEEDAPAPFGGDGRAKWASKSEVAGTLLSKSESPVRRTLRRDRSRGQDEPPPTMLPRSPPRKLLRAGTVSTLHASRQDGDELIAQAEKHNPSDAGNYSRLLANLGPKDRKWLLRQASISATMSSLGQAAAKSPRPAIEEEDPSPVHEYLSFAGWGLDDDYVCTLLARAQLYHVRVVNLSENRITEATIVFLNEALQRAGNESLESLLLGQNRLGTVGGRAVVDFLKDSLGALQQLDLTENNLGDQACTELCEALGSASRVRHLVGLSLARNNLGDSPKTGAALCHLVGNAPRLQALDLHWNRFQGAGAASLIQGFYDNSYSINGQLWRVNLGWNRVGLRCNHASQNRIQDCKCELCRGCTKAIACMASVFTDCSALFHLDLSYNSICATDCCIMGEALKSNHTLFGLHLVGNEAKVDDIGLLRPRVAKEDFEDSMRRLAEDEILSMSLDEAVRNTPRKLRLDRIGQLEQARLEESSAADFAKELTFGRKCNPSLHAINGAAAFSTQDLKVEKDWLSVHCKVPLSSSDFNAKADFEDVRLNERCCWICENWVDQAVSYIPGWSGYEEEPDEVLQVFAFFSIDGFTKPTLLTKTSQKYIQREFLGKKSHGSRMPNALDGAAGTSGGYSRPNGHERANRSAASRPGVLLRMRKPLVYDNGTYQLFSGSRMLPPTTVPIRVVFQVNNQIVCSLHLPKVTLKSLATVRVHSTGRQSASEPLPAMPVVDGNEPEFKMKEANEITVGTDAWNLLQKGLVNTLCLMEDPRLRSDVKVLPRKLQHEHADTISKVWSFERSMFSSYQKDSATLFSESFDHDIAVTRLNQFWKSGLKIASDADEVQAYLRSVYGPIMAAYHGSSLKGFDSYHGSASISMSGFADLLAAKAAFPTSRPTLKRSATSMPRSSQLSRSGSNPLKQSQAVVDGGMSQARSLYGEKFTQEVGNHYFLFVQVLDQENTELKNFLGLPKTGIARFQFLEVLVKAAFSKQNDKHLGSVETVRKFVEDARIGQDITNLRKTLHDALFCEECCLLVRNNRQLLEEAFSTYSKRLPCQGLGPNFMSFGAWLEFLEASEMTFLASEDRGFAFALGKEICVEAHRSFRHMALSWAEFLVCLGAVVRLGGDFTASTLPDRLLDLFEDHVQKAIQASKISAAKVEADAEFTAANKWGTEPGTQEIVKLLTQVFTEADDDHSGLVTSKELMSYVRQRWVAARFQEIGFNMGDMRILNGRLGSALSDGLTLEELIEGVLRLRRAMAGLERAIHMLRKAFCDADTDGLGRLSRAKFFNFLEFAEMQDKLKSTGLTLADVNDLWATAHKVNGVEVTEDAMIAGLLDLREGRGQVIRGLSYLQQVFVLADCDKSGSLNREEVRRYLCRQEVVDKLTSLNLQVPNWLGLFDVFDEDSDDQLSWQEISNAMSVFWAETSGKGGAGAESDDDDCKENSDEEEHSVTEEPDNGGATSAAVREGDVAPVDV